MHFKHQAAEIKGISRLASSIACDDLKKVENEIYSCLKVTSKEKVYETILQSYLFCGFPAVIESLRLFRKLSDGYSKKAESYNARKFNDRGRRNCRKIYLKNYDNLIANMDAISPDLRQWMITEGYGKVMGRSGLDLLERECVNVSILCTRYYENQLYAHIKGCLNNGATSSDLKKLFIALRGIAAARNINKAIELLKKITGKSVA